MNPLLNMAQYAFGVDYSSPTNKIEQVSRITTHVKVMIAKHRSKQQQTHDKIVWSIDRFNARTGNQIFDARRSLAPGSHSTTETDCLLKLIDSEKRQSSNLITAIIEESWIGYANAMGIEFRELCSPES